MATIEEKNILEALSKNLDVISKTQVEDLIRPELGGELNFESGRETFSRNLKLFKDLSNCNLENIPVATLEQLNSKVGDFITRMKKVKDFSANQTSPVNVRDSIVKEFQNQYQTYFTSIHPIISYSIRKGTDFEKLENQAKETVKKLIDIQSKFQEDVNSKLKESESILNKIRDAAANVGVAQHSSHFEIEAGENYEASIKWFWGTIFMAILTIGWGIGSVFLYPNIDDTAKIIQFVVSKIIILSALYYGLVWSAKNFKALRHNYIVNKHRQNALKTFETFVKAAGDDMQTKNAVLLQATYSIFSSQNSGYNSVDPDSENPNKIVEIIKNVASNASSR